MDGLLGKKITFTKRLYRQRGTFPNNRGGYHSGKTWNERECKEMTGFIIGRRVLQEGFSEWWGEEEGNVWVRKGSISAYLVTVSMNKKPIYIPIDEVELTDE